AFRTTLLLPKIRIWRFVPEPLMTPANVTVWLSPNRSRFTTLFNIATVPPTQRSALIALISEFVAAPPAFVSKLIPKLIVLLPVDRWSSLGCRLLKSKKWIVLPPKVQLAVPVNWTLFMLATESLLLLVRFVPANVIVPYPGWAPPQLLLPPQLLEPPLPVQVFPARAEATTARQARRKLRRADARG